MNAPEKNLRREALYLFIAVAIALAAAGRSLWQGGIPAGHDALEYPVRLAEFMMNLKAGILFPAWAPDLSDGYGQPFFIFNPPMSYYLAAIFNFLGFSLAASWNAMALATLCMMAVFMYLFAREYYPGRGALLASALYVCAPYTLCEIYVRSALAEFLAMAWLPLCFLAAKKTVENRKTRFAALLSISTMLLLLTHNPAALICVPFLALYVIYLSVANKTWRGLFRSAGAGLAGIGLSAYFLLPVFFEKHLIQVEQLRSDSVLEYANHFLYASQWIVPNWQYGLSVPGINDGMPFQIGIVHLIAIGCAVIGLFPARKKHPAMFSAFVFFAAAALLSLFMTHHFSKFIWDRIAALQYMQFPWRFLVFTAFGAAMLGGAAVLLLERAGGAFPAIAFAVALVVVLAFPHARGAKSLTLDDHRFSAGNIARQGLSATTRREYRPADAPARLPFRHSLIELQDAQVKIISRKPNELTARIESPESGWGLIRQFHFPGWRLWINGKPAELKVDRVTGAMTFPVQTGGNDLHLRYVGTRLQRIGKMISLILALSGFLFVIVFRLPRLRSVRTGRDRL
ncbi:MAG TPA: 6-pyruvoyl-tetrahydropterin synthase-related protein [bacterium]|nr:6-pyruvoyl-tetrahydropterin synthase-related protein [bacterium]